MIIHHIDETQVGRVAMHMADQIVIIRDQCHLSMRCNLHHQVNQQITMISLDIIRNHMASSMTHLAGHAIITDLIGNQITIIKGHSINSSST